MDRVEKLQEMLRESPEDSFLRHALALEYIKSGDDGKARGLLEALLESDPSYTGSYYHLGKLLERMGEAMLAADYYMRGMAVAKAAGSQRTYNELQGAYDELDL